MSGLRSGGLASSKGGRKASEDLERILSAHIELHPDLLVMTGLRAGAEELAASVAGSAGVPYAVVLPYPDPASGWPERERAGFDRALAGAAEVVVLERRRPSDGAGRKSALSRRDGWMRSACDAAVVLTDGTDREAEDILDRWEHTLGADTWRLDVTP